MEEDDYYLDRYDCQSARPPPTMAAVAPAAATTSRQSSTESGPRSLEMDDGEAMLGTNDEDYYEDDYDHLYGDTDGAEAYLREIWTQLGVGDNGYLNLAELYRVCEHIGMSASEEMIEQLFDKLDNDQDGRVSFVEFVDGLFKYVHKTTAATTVPATNSSRPVSGSQDGSSLDPAAATTHAQPSGGDFASTVQVNSATSTTTTPGLTYSSFMKVSSPPAVSPSTTAASSTNSSPAHHASTGGTASPSLPTSTRLITSTSMDSSSTVGFITIPTDKDG